MSGLYLHIPFCRKKCGYCGFVSYAGGESIHKRYCSALKRELLLLAKSHHAIEITTLFVGGGTPTTLAENLLPELIGYAVDLFSISPHTEITVETNPNTVNSAELKRLRAAGCNRLSIGVQSFLDTELVRLGRIHNAEEAKQTFLKARQAGFCNISLDLMYGLPGQKWGDWEKSLSEAISLQPDHLSLYQLSIEPETAFEHDFSCNKLVLPSEDEIIKMDGITEKYCGDSGFKRYEISNYCRDEKRCRHNLTYWENGEYLAAGAGSVSYVQGARERRCSDPLNYIEAIEQERSPIIEREVLDNQASFRETVIMGLRLVDGVCLSSLYKRFDIDLCAYYGSRLTKLLDTGFLELGEGSLRLTSKGLPLANRVMAELV